MYEDMKDKGRLKIQMLPSEMTVYEWEGMEEVCREKYKCNMSKAGEYL